MFWYDKAVQDMILSTKHDAKPQENYGMENQGHVTCVNQGHVLTKENTRAKEKKN